MAPPAKRRVPIGRVLVAVSIVPVIAGCDEQQDALAPKSHQATDIATLFWWMMGIAWIGLALVVVMMLLAWRRARRRSGHGPKEGEKAAFMVVIGGGIVFPIALIAALFVVADIFVIKTTQAPARGATELTIRIVAHQWWWEVRYPGTSAVTANELHIPARTPVRIDASSADVIHSFWVPRLNRTIDAFPDRTTSIELDADTPGRYRGQCDEYCGLQHAHMAFYVYADPPKRFRAWLANQERPAAVPQGAVADRGRQVVVDGPCGDCHSIRGTSATSDVGPDLTHLRSRTTLAALALPNTRANLARWIEHPQDVKPGNEMPDLHLPQTQLQAVVAYLEQLR